MSDQTAVPQPAEQPQQPVEAGQVQPQQESQMQASEAPAEDPEQPQGEVHEWRGEYDAAGVPLCAVCRKPWPCPDAGMTASAHQTDSQPGPALQQ